MFDVTVNTSNNNMVPNMMKTANEKKCICLISIFPFLGIVNSVSKAVDY